MTMACAGPNTCPTGVGENPPAREDCTNPETAGACRYYIPQMRASRRRDRRLGDDGRRLAGRRRDGRRRRTTDVETCGEWCASAGMLCVGMYDDSENSCNQKDNQPEGWNQTNSCEFTGDEKDSDWICECIREVKIALGDSGSLKSYGCPESSCNTNNCGRDCEPGGCAHGCAYCTTECLMDYPMTDDDGDGIWARSFPVPSGYQDHYAFFYGAMEDLSGQDCADPNNDDYRTTPVVTEDTVISVSFGVCPPATTASAPTSPEPADTVKATSAPTGPSTSIVTIVLLKFLHSGFEDVIFQHLRFCVVS